MRTDRCRVEGKFTAAHRPLDWFGPQCPARQAVHSAWPSRGDPLAAWAWFSGWRSAVAREHVSGMPIPMGTDEDRSSRHCPHSTTQVPSGRCTTLGCRGMGSLWTGSLLQSSCSSFAQDFGAPGRSAVRDERPVVCDGESLRRSRSIWIELPRFGFPPKPCTVGVWWAEWSVATPPRRSASRP